MLQSIIDYFIIKLQALNIATVYGLAELVYNTETQTTYPSLYIGSGQYEPISFDNHQGVIYFRKLNVSNSFVESVLGEDGNQRIYTIKLVAFIPKSVYNTDDKYIDDKLAGNIQLILDNDSDTILIDGLNAENVSISTISYETDRRNVLLAEGLEGNIPFEYAFISIDLNITVTGSQDCFEIYGCNDTPIDYLELLRDAVCVTVCPEPPTLQETIDANTATDIAAAIDTADKENDVFTDLAPVVLLQTVEDSLSATQRNSLTRINLLKAGATPVSYAVGDLGSTNRGRGEFLTLSVDNPSADPDRFELYGTDVVIDWAVGCYWTRTIRASANWDTHNAAAQALTLDGLTGWYLPSEDEYIAILDRFLGDPLGYAPFNQVLSNQRLWANQIWIGSAAYAKSVFFYSGARSFITDYGLTRGQNAFAYYIKYM